ncbi:MAG: RNA 3'-terminal phosphate cyclase [Polyangiaceae bacterium]|nr:RNA 3'-terminal phosphate cyclase [Polyangiaceae bacterium]
MITIDGSEGEGGGQILRTTLALSLVLRTPVTITNIRKGRAKPGLLRQHLAAVNAAAAVGAAEVTGAELLSGEVTLRPTAILGGRHRFAIGSAGSTILLLQTVLPALLVADAPSQLVLEGGTHNPSAPPFPHLQRAFLPLLERMGARVRAECERPGFYPAGGGRLVINITPAALLTPFSLLERGATKRVWGVAVVANLPPSIAVREMAAVRSILGGDEESFRPQVLRDALGPGNVVTIDVESEHVTEVFTGFGERGVRAEKVGERVAREARDYLDSNAVVGEHLADQLLLPMVLAGSGAFRTVEPSSHTTTQADLLRKILGAKIRFVKDGEQSHVVEIER